MNKMLALVFVVGGVLLVAFGIGASDSLGADVSRFFSSFPGSKAMWMLFGGLALAVVGLAGVLRRQRMAT